MTPRRLTRWFARWCCVLGERPGRGAAHLRSGYYGEAGAAPLLEHVASAGARGRVQRFVDATFRPRLAGNCHTHVTSNARSDAGIRGGQLPAGGHFRLGAATGVRVGSGPRAQRPSYS